MLLARRSIEKIRHHYRIEKNLAQRLMSSQAEERTSLYSDLYDELFRQVPDHPQLMEKNDGKLEGRRVKAQTRLLRPLLNKDTVFLEVGAGGCALAKAISDLVKHCFAVDVSQEICADVEFTEHFQFKQSNGTSIPVPDHSVDLVYSNQLMEHLHPDDAIAQLHNVYRVLKPGGRYVCVTPSRLSGPHDVSQHFDDTATGFHLREYTNSELVKLFQQVGFKSFSCFIGYGGWGLRVPLAGIQALEDIVNKIPKVFRRAIARFPPVRIALGVKLFAVK